MTSGEGARESELCAHVPARAELFTGWMKVTSADARLFDRLEAGEQQRQGLGHLLYLYVGCGTSRGVSSGLLSGGYA